MTTIKLKNGSGAPAASDLVQGEPALDLTNKRLYSEDASGNVIEVGTNPTNLTVTGNVGIANTNPSAFDQVGADTLVVGSGSGEQGITVYSGTANNGVLAFADGTTTTEQYQGFIGYNHSGNFMRFFTAASERMRIDSSGNVGIGSTGNAKLQVFGPSASPSLGTYANSAAIISNNAGGYGVSFSVDGTGTGYIQAQNFTSSAAYNLSLSPAGGNVGIGTDSPDQLLDVGDHTSPGDRSIRISQRTATAAQTYGGIEFFYDNSLTNTGVNAAIYYAAGTARNNGELTFHTGTSASIAERMRIDSSGRVGIGIATPNTASGNTDNLVINDNGNAGITIRTEAASGYSSIYFADSASATVGRIEYQHGGNDMLFYTTGSEAMRIDSSGNFLIGTSSAIGSATNTADNFTFSSTSGYAWLSVSDAGGVYIQRQNDGKVLSFFRATSIVGSISVDSVSPTTNYNTTSDQRLKENIVDAPAGNIDDIRVRSFDWKDGGFHQSHGMIAQELVVVAPEAVTQGATDDDMWSVDYSKLVPMMIKEIQDLRARVAQLEGA